MDFVNLFTRPPGDLLYFLAVVAISLAGFLMALGQRLRRPQDYPARRYMVALAGTMVAWVLLMSGAMYSLLTNENAALILPPLERAVNVVSLLLIGWAFITADHRRFGRRSNVILLLVLAVVIVGYILTGLQFPEVAAAGFNASPYGFAWAVIPAALCVLGMLLILLYFNLVVDAPLKLVFFVVLLLGYGATAAQIQRGMLAGDYSGLARIAFLAALPLVPTIIYRMVVARLQTESAMRPATRAELSESPTSSKRPDGLQPGDTPRVSDPNPLERESVQLLKALGMILEEGTPDSIPHRVVTSALDVLKGDVGALFNVQDANYADVKAAYNGVQKRKISGMALNLNDQPTLVNAMERRLQRPLYSDRNNEELHDLYTRLDIEQMGPAYLQPLTCEGELLAMLVVGMPYTQRELDSHERELLRGIGILGGRLLKLSYAANDAQVQAEERAIQAVLQGVSPEEIENDAVLAARQEMQANLDLSREQINELTRQVMQLKLELDDERSRLTAILGDTKEGLSISQRIVALNDEQQILREERDRLANRLQEAQTALVGATATGDVTVFNAIIDALQSEKDELITQRESLREQLDELRSAGGAPMPQVVQEVLQRMGEERGRLEVERERLNGRLSEIEGQLGAVGIDSTAGLAQVVAQLHEQRAALQTKNDILKRERDALVSERKQFEDAIQREKERDKQLELLQNEMQNLAADREVITKRRDQIRIERDEIAAKLETLKQQRTRLVAQNAAYQDELKESHTEQAQLRTQIQQLAGERSDLIAERDRLTAEVRAVETERDQLMARVEGDRARLQQLGENGVGSLTRMIEELSEQRNQLEHELHETRTALADVQNQLEALEVRADSVPAGAALNNPELVLGVMQELRTPMTSIVGYVELLLGESAGILGEMQRKFLQRVETNVSRLAAMIDDTVHLMTMEAGQFSMTPEPLDVVGLIEDTITDATTQFREKGLTVHLNLETRVPSLRADRDAIHQIINQLLTNAYLVSPPESEIFITARRRNVALSTNGTQAPVDCLMVSIEDRGGGIASDDMPRVFSRKYKADNPLIQGLGDTGVGLSIARALVEAHGGKLWLETRDDVGSVFHFALPFAAKAEYEV